MPACSKLPLSRCQCHSGTQFKLDQTLTGSNGSWTCSKSYESLKQVKFQQFQAPNCIRTMPGRTTCTRAGRKFSKVVLILDLSQNIILLLCSQWPTSDSLNLGRQPSKFPSIFRYAAQNQPILVYMFCLFSLPSSSKLEQTVRAVTFLIIFKTICPYLQCPDVWALEATVPRLVRHVFLLWCHCKLTRSRGDSTVALPGLLCHLLCHQTTMLGSGRLYIDWNLKAPEQHRLPGSTHADAKPRLPLAGQREVNVEQTVTLQLLWVVTNRVLDGGQTLSVIIIARQQGQGLTAARAPAPCLWDITLETELSEAVADSALSLSAPHEAYTGTSSWTWSHSGFRCSGCCCRHGGRLWLGVGSVWRLYHVFSASGLYLSHSLDHTKTRPWGETNLKVDEWTIIIWNPGSCYKSYKSYKSYKLETLGATVILQVGCYITKLSYGMSNLLQSMLNNIVMNTRTANNMLYNIYNPCYIIYIGNVAS